MNLQLLRDLKDCLRLAEFAREHPEFLAAAGVPVPVTADPPKPPAK